MLTSSPNGRITTSAAILRQRLQGLTGAFVLAQFGYCIIGFLVIQNVRQMPEQHEPNQPLLTALTLVAIIALGMSFVAVHVFSRRRMGEGIKGFFRGMLRQLIVGAAIAEMAGIIGLVVYYLSGNWVVLAVLACLAAGVIVAHYLRIATMLDSFERRQP